MLIPLLYSLAEQLQPFRGLNVPQVRADDGPLAPSLQAIKTAWPGLQPLLSVQQACHNAIPLLRTVLNGGGR